MRGIVWMASGLLMCTAATAMAANHGKASHGLTAAQIVARNVAARGGLHAWRAVKSLKFSGKMEAGGKKNTELPFVLEMQRPHKSRLEISFRNQQAVQVYDGSHGWKVRPFLGRNDVEPFSPTEAKAAQAWAELDGPLVDYKRKGSKIQLQGIESVEGHKSYKLLLTTKDGNRRHVWVDAKSFLERKIDGQRRRLDGKLRYVAVYYRDYRKEHGLTMPHVFETVVTGGAVPHKLQIDHVEVNPALATTLFDKPQLALAPAAGRSDSH